MVHAFTHVYSFLIRSVPSAVPLTDDAKEPQRGYNGVHVTELGPLPTSHCFSFHKTLLVVLQHSAQASVLMFFCTMLH